MLSQKRWELGSQALAFFQLWVDKKYLCSHRSHFFSSYLRFPASSSSFSPNLADTLGPANSFLIQLFSQPCVNTKKHKKGPKCTWIDQNIKAQFRKWCLNIVRISGQHTHTEVCLLWRHTTRKKNIFDRNINQFAFGGLYIYFRNISTCLHLVVSRYILRNILTGLQVFHLVVFISCK